MKINSIDKDQCNTDEYLLQQSRIKQSLGGVESCCGQLRDEDNIMSSDLAYNKIQWVREEIDKVIYAINKSRKVSVKAPECLHDDYIIYGM